MAQAQTQAKTEDKTAKSMKAAMDKICKGLPTKSAKIRALDAKGYTRSQIKDHLGIIYQHVRNVLVTPVKTPKS